MDPKNRFLYLRWQEMPALFVRMGFSKIVMKISLQQIMVSTGAAIQITHTRRHLNDSQKYLHHMKIQEEGKYTWYGSIYCKLKK